MWGEIYMRGLPFGFPQRFQRGFWDIFRGWKRGENFWRVCTQRKVLGALNLGPNFLPQVGICVGQTPWGGGGAPFF